MGLLVTIYRSDYDSDQNAFRGKHHVTVVNAAGPFDPTPAAPAARIVRNATGMPVIVPVDVPEGMVGPMSGGTFAGSSDSRFGEAVRAFTGQPFYGALPVHDRYETIAQYHRLSAD